MTKRTDDARRHDRLNYLGDCIRRRRGPLTQAQLGERMGVPQTTVSRWEKGLVDLGLDAITRLDAALGLEPGTLANEAGFFSLEVGEDWPDSFRTGYFDTFDDAVEELTAAAKLDLGVRLHNRWRSNGSGGHTQEWVVVLATDAPGFDDE